MLEFRIARCECRTGVLVEAVSAAKGRARSSPEPRLAPDAEPALERPILLAILTRCPNEEVADEGEGDGEDDHSDYLSGEVHRKRWCCRFTVARLTLYS
jgi:hypothetical protein